MTSLFLHIVVGLAASLGLIGLAKVLMAGLLQRENGYYQDAYDPETCHPGGEDHE